MDSDTPDDDEFILGIPKKEYVHWFDNALAGFKIHIHQFVDTINLVAATHFLGENQDGFKKVVHEQTLYNLMFSYIRAYIDPDVPVSEIEKLMILFKNDRLGDIREEKIKEKYQGVAKIYNLDEYRQRKGGK